MVEKEREEEDSEERLQDRSQLRIRQETQTTVRETQNRQSVTKKRAQRFVVDSEKRRGCRAAHRLCQQHACGPPGGLSVP